MGKIFTVDEVASVLKLHPRTIRRKIACGDIQAVKVGKQYRISQEQLDSLCGKEADYINENLISVSSIIEIENISEPQSIEIDRKITSIFMSGIKLGNIHCSYQSELRRQKIFIDCSLDRAPEISSMLKIYLNSILNKQIDGKDF